MESVEWLDDTTFTHDNGIIFTTLCMYKQKNNDNGKKLTYWWHKKSNWMYPTHASLDIAWRASHLNIPPNIPATVYLYTPLGVCQPPDHGQPGCRAMWHIKSSTSWSFTKTYNPGHVTWSNWWLQTSCIGPILQTPTSRTVFVCPAMHASCRCVTPFTLEGYGMSASDMMWIPLQIIKYRRSNETNLSRLQYKLIYVKFIHFNPHNNLTGMPVAFLID